MRQFGLIGYPLGHSFSKNYFTEKFRREGITDAAYELYPIEHISLLPGILEKNPQLAGLNVTIPHKEAVLPFLAEKSQAVLETGACNCIKISKGVLCGFNTDVIGFAQSLKPYLGPQHTKALILGTGGAAKAVAWVLEKAGINYIFVSRSGPGLSYQQINQDIIVKHKLIINTTPLGMQPNTEKKPSIPYSKLTAGHLLFDLVYNPPKTRFLEEGEQYGAVIVNGLQMLEIQAEESWKIWNS
jgi:shikimate dehydrogenase